MSILCLSESYDWCSLLKPNNTYKGLGIYHKFDSNGDGKYIMYDTNGKQWFFGISGSDGQVLQKMRISRKKDLPIDTPVYEHRFGMLLVVETAGKLVDYYLYDCYVKQLVINV